MSYQELIISGARQNNLKNISLKLPHDKVIAITGVSGSGKSSLAFDTVFAEGQWRFIESLSTYARMFLEKMDRPDVDEIKNVRPAIALEQRNPARGSRSTVGTQTEIYDYLRLAFSKASTPFCPQCGREIIKWDTSSIRADLLEKYSGRRAAVVFPTGGSIDALLKKGYLRALKEGRISGIEELKGTPPPYEIVLDRLVVEDEARLSDSLEAAYREGAGSLKIFFPEGGEVKYSAGNTCENCGITIPEPTPLLFSFNHPLGACPVCKGFGNILIYDDDLIIQDPLLSLGEGAVEPFEKPAASWWKRQFMKGAAKSGVDLKTPYYKLGKEQKRLINEGNEDFHGINSFFEDLEGMKYKLHVRVFLSRYRKAVKCTSCGGKRLKPDALAYRLSGLDIADICSMPVSRLGGFMDDLDISSFTMDIIKEPLRQISLKLGFLKSVGLDYLTLTRETKTLSGGEYQRVSLSNQLASRLTGTLYVLDEPTVGLHKRDIDRIASKMTELSALGNTVMVVEHDMGIIKASDWVVELGPGGGSNGGAVVYSGPKDEFLNAGTITSEYIKSPFAGFNPKPRRPVSWLEIKGASGNNLKNIDVSIPVGAFTVVSGVSGSGKSTLVVDTLYKALLKKLRLGSLSALPFDKINGHEAFSAVKLIDQSPIGKSPRSNPATYMKLFDMIRKLFAGLPDARAQAYGPGFFSFNVPGGRCDACAGEGYQKLEMYFFEDLFVKCEECGGRRYGPDALSIKYMGRGIDEVLEMTVSDAMGFFSATPQLARRLGLLNEVGLGYLLLGQPATTLSGGEAQRLKVCADLGGVRAGNTLYILDEPTVGLHSRDIDALLKVLNRLVDGGSTVLVIEHNLEVIASADWSIDIGPEGGEGGGMVLYSGIPEGLADSKKSHTGRCIREVM